MPGTLLARTETVRRVGRFGTDGQSTEFLEWLRVNTGSLVIEWVAPEDPMAHRLLARKGPGEHPDYRTDWFERCLAERFDVVRSEVLAEGKRTLYLARSKA